MAPALTEPLSPKEKLSSSATTAPASLSTRSSKKLDPPTSSAASESVLANKSANIPAQVNSTKEKKPSRLTPTPTTSTRVTRSKDAHQSGSQKFTTSTPIITRKNNKLGNDQMGLSAARNSNSPSTTTNNNNNNNLAIKETEITDTIVPSDNQTQQQEELQEEFPDKVVTSSSPDSKDNSTEQLLADLTNDFEEAITAEICLRNKLPEVELSKEATGETTAGAKDIVAINSTVPVAVGGEEVSTSDVVFQHMESQLAKATEEPTTQATENVVLNAKVEEKVKISDETNEPTVDIQQAGDVVSGVAPNNTATQFKQTGTEKPSCSRAHIVSVEELPPVGTDSTMTASEIEDNLEERLSQLDGNVIVPPVNAHEQLGSQELGSSTPSRSSATQQQLQLEAQLPLTPSVPETAPLEQQQQLQPPQQQLATLTPQSTTSTLSSVNLPQGFLKENATGDELGDQDIEEVLKALKGLDGVTNTDTFGDLNIFFNDVFQTVSTYPNFEEINSQNASTSNAAKTSPIKESYADMEKKQELVTSRIDGLLRRMRKLQARNMCKHTSLEIAGIFEWSARICNKASNPVRSTALSEQEAAVMSVVSGRPPTNFWQEQKRNPLPSAQMSTMLRQLETVANEKQLSTTSSHSTANSLFSMAMHTKRSKKNAQQEALATANLTPNSAAESKGDEIVPNFDTYVTGELSHVAGLLHTEMREVQNAIDSDATESSSGGESADEMVNYNNQTQQPLSISKRAVWRYSRDRAAIALRWSWLMTQVNDLEVKIRQHSELYNELNRSKGEIVLDSPPPPSTTSASKNNNNNNNNNSSNKSQETITNSVNGYKSNVSDSESEVETTACSRTRGLKLSEFRKRKLFQTTNMHTISKKAARPSTIKCGCQWPRQPCALCTGRADPTAPRALPDTMMPANRVALLDPGYHPVLSFSDDVCQSIHFESICRQPEWQYRVMRCQAKAIAKGVWKAEREAAALLPGGKRHGEPTKRRYIRRKERNATTATAGGNDDKMSTSSRTGGVVTNDSGNGTASTPSTTTTSTTPTTPLVANKLAKRQRRSKNKNMAMHENPTKIDQYNNYNSQAHSTLISNNNNSNSYKNRKSSATITTSNSNYNSLNQYSHTSQFNTSSMTTTAVAAAGTTANINGDNNFLNNSNSDQWDGGIGTQRSRTASPTQGSKSGQQRHERSSRSRISYDIDNIVIPYSIAAATRVEILPYKEIPTPKWRVIDRDSSEELETSTEDETKSEQAEKTEQAAMVDKVEACSTQTTAAKDNTPAQTLDIKIESKDQPRVVTSTEAKITTKVNGAVVKAESTSTHIDSSATNEIGEVKQSNNTLLPPNAKNINAVNEKSTQELSALNETRAQTVENVHNNIMLLKDEEKTPKNNNIVQVDALTPKTNNNNKLINGKVNKDQTVVKQEELTKIVEVKDETQEKNVENIKLEKDKDIKADECDLENVSATKIVNNKKIDNGEQLTSVTNNIKKELDELMHEPELKKRKLENGTTENGDGGVKSEDVVGVVAKDNVVDRSSSNSMKAPPVPQTPKDTIMPSTSAEAAANAIADAALNADCEDTSEEVFMARHQRALIEERRKFVTYLKFPFSTRSRANRRSDSRAESSGANTPDPTSPAPHTPSIGGGDNESIPSPLAQTQPHANPLDVLQEASESINAMSSASSKLQHSKRQERRRTTSLKNNNKELERRSVSPEFVPPYEPLQFPLPENVYQQMLNEMEESYKRKRIFKFNEGINAYSVPGTSSSNSRATSSARDVVSGKSKRTNTIKSTSSMSYINSVEASGSGGRRNQHSKTSNSSKRKVGGEQRLNGKIQHTDADGEYGDVDDDLLMPELPEDILDDVEDDDYPKHYLAPNDDLNNYYDDGADAYIGHSPRANESESDVDDPFMDDDPNDPEWKRGLGERSEQRIRRKM